MSIPSQPGGPPEDVQSPGARPPVSLSTEEQKVLRSCQSESFWYRSLPLSGILAGAAHMAVQSGLLKPHASWGSRPKVILGTVLGYFLGKASYADACADKFLVEAPDTNIAEAIRVRRGVAPRDKPPPDVDQQLYQQSPPPVYPGDGQGDQQQLSGYEEMRRRNRDQTPGAPPPTFPPLNQQPPPIYGGGAPYLPLNVPPPLSEATPDLPKRKVRVNQYGDEVYD